MVFVLQRPGKNARRFRFENNNRGRRRGFLSPVTVVFLLFRFRRVVGVQRTDGLVVRRQITRLRRVAPRTSDRRRRLRTVVAVHQRFLVLRTSLFAHSHQAFHAFLEYRAAAATTTKHRCITDPLRRRQSNRFSRAHQTNSKKRYSASSDVRRYSKKKSFSTIFHRKLLAKNPCAIRCIP